MAERGHRYRGIKRRDTNHPEIVTMLGDVPGLQVIDCSQFGDDFPDLMLGIAGHWLLLELKFGRGKLREGQALFAADAQGPVAVAWTRGEVLDLVLSWRTWAIHSPRFTYPQAGGNCG